jgi:hypothetical protein
MIELIAGIAYFVFVFFKAFQQRNVSWMNYKYVMPISYLMSVSEVIVISTVAYTGAQLFPFSMAALIEILPMIFAIGTGGGLGCLSAMYLHHRYVK